MRESINYLTKTHLFICAICGIQMYDSFSLLDKTLDYTYLFFCMAGVLFVYNLHRELILQKTPTHQASTNYFDWDIKNKILRRVTIATAGIYLLFSISKLPLLQTQLLFSTALFSMIYLLPKSFVRKNLFAKVIVLCFSWWMVIAVIPILTTTTLSIKNVLLLIDKLILLFAIGFLFQHKDLAKDIETKELDYTNTHLPFNISLLLLLFGMVFTTLLYAISTINETFFYCTLLQFLIAIPLFYVTKKEKSENYYLLFVDGVLLLKPLLIVEFSK
ncbi:MAG: hypothetical protein J0M08_03355 [Bacteroidetes bacterium]|nr:hypothetical protein [Bacteroidota bacterium]